MPVLVYVPPANASKDEMAARMSVLANQYEMTAICDIGNVHLKVRPTNTVGFDFRKSPIKIPQYLHVHKEITADGRTDLDISVDGHFIERPHPLFGKTYVFGVLIDESSPQTPS